MGGFYGSVQVRSDNREEIRASLEQVGQDGTRFLLGPSLNGWVGIYPEGGGQDFSVARTLAQVLSGEIVAMLVHDDDLFAYEYHRDGQLIDQYNSVPDYFDEVSDQDRRDLQGQPETFAHLAVDPAKFQTLKERLSHQAEEPDVFASELLAEFADTLGIRNAVTSYEYLQEDEEPEDIQGWDQFLHIPDLAPELARKQAAEALILEQKANLIQKGRLLAEHGGHRGFAASTPWWSPAPDGRGFLVAWSSHADSAEGSVPLEFFGPPWTGGATPTPWTIGRHVYGITKSPSGRFLAVAHAAGDWKASLWDLEENRQVAETPQIRAVSCVGFLPDESAMFSVSSEGEKGQVLLSSTGVGDSRTLPVAHAKLAASHPSGNWLVVADNFSRLIVVDVATFRLERTHFVGGLYSSTALERQVKAGLDAAAATIDIEAVIQQVRLEQEKLLKSFGTKGLPPGMGSIEDLKRQFEEDLAKITKRQFEEDLAKISKGFAQLGQPSAQHLPERGTEQVFRFLFDRSGDHLCVATSGGVRVYSWDDVRNLDGDLRPILSVDVPATQVETRHGPTRREGYVYDLDLDTERDRLLFAGLDGRVRFLDLASGRSGVILEPPVLAPILRVGLSGDGQTLALTTSPDMPENGRDRRGPVLQFWDYRALAQD